MNASRICERLQAIGRDDDRLVLQRFFKTGPGEYGEGDVFVGIRVPELRKLAREYEAIPLSEITKLLRSPIHEARLLALLILVRLYALGDAVLKGKIYRLYLRNTRYINNWDLVDCSAEHIVGPYLKHLSRATLYALAGSRMLWERRISIIATFHYIKGGEFEETLNIAELLLDDPEDLIHKAVGWMLREIGKRDQLAEERFLKEHCRTMPRTMLRYAIERFPVDLRQRFLRGDIE